MFYTTFEWTNISFLEVLRAHFLLAQDIICILWFLVKYDCVGFVACLLFCNLDILKHSVLVSHPIEEPHV